MYYLSKLSSIPWRRHFLFPTMCKLGKSHTASGQQIQIAKARSSPLTCSDSHSHVHMPPGEPSQRPAGNTALWDSLRDGPMCKTYSQLPTTLRISQRQHTHLYSHAHTHRSVQAGVLERAPTACISWKAKVNMYRSCEGQLLGIRRSWNKWTERNMETQEEKTRQRWEKRLAASEPGLVRPVPMPSSPRDSSLGNNVG